jgi:HK97 family phage prohead protease
MSEIEFRSVQLAEVSFPQRTVELIVMPYETEAVVSYKGRMITEICSHGAFAGVERRSSRIKVNLDHDFHRPVGRTVALHPSRQEGLVAEIKISRIEEGERALVMADDGILDASAGFTLLTENGRVKPNAEVWESRERRRLNHLYLDHIALTPDPAYADARVLAVRNTNGEPEPPATPNLDSLQLEEYRRVYADINRRYGLTR